MPPRAVRMPWAASMPRMSSGLVSMRRRSTRSPRAAHASASGALNTTLPLAAPGPAASPLASTLFSATARRLLSGEKMGRRSWLSCSGSTRMSASSGSMRPSATISTAMRMAARPVRLPLRVCSMYRRPRSTVNSKSCMSRSSCSSVWRTCRSWSYTSGNTSLSSTHRPRRAHAGDHVLALGVDQELAVEDVLAAGRVAREGDAGARLVAGVAVDHRLHVHGRAPVVGDVVELPVGDGAVVVPGAEHGRRWRPRAARAGPRGSCDRCAPGRRP